MKVNVRGSMKTPPPPPALGQPRDPSTKPVYLDITRSDDSSVILKYSGNGVAAGSLIDILRTHPCPHEDVQRVEEFKDDLYGCRQATLTNLDLDEGLITVLVDKAS